MKTSVIYARVSSTNDRQSTARQVYDLSNYSTQHAYETIHVFEEHCSGAKRNEERSVLLECLEFCKLNKIDTILVSELSRIGRDVDEVLATVRFCKDNGINIFFQKEGLSLFQADGTKNPFLNIFISVLATCASIERQNIQFRLNSGRQRFIDSGGFIGRPVGTIKSKEQKAVQYKSVLKELRHGTSIRRTAKLTGISERTVQRLKKEFQL